MFTSRGRSSPCRANQPAKLPGSSASPPKITHRNDSPLPTPPASSARINCRNADGVWFNTVTPSRSTNPQNSSGDRLTPCGTTTNRPPYSNAPHISHTEKSSAYEWNSVHTSPRPNPNPSSVTSNRRTTFACVTTTPFGSPVDPDVYITYAASSGLLPPSSHSSSSSLPHSNNSSTNTTGPENPGTRLSNPRCVTSTRAPQSSAIYRSRSSGYSGSIGTYAPPDFNTPNIPTTKSNDRSTHKPTRVSRLTPNDRSRRPRMPDRRSRSPYVSDSPPNTTAIPSPRSPATRPYHSCKLPPTAPLTPPFHSSNTRLRSARPMIRYSESGRAGSAAIPSRSRR